MKKNGKLILNPINPRKDKNSADVLLGTPTLGLLRIEWVNAMNMMVYPPNWSIVRSSPTDYTTPDAQNLLVNTLLRGSFRALLMIEDDTCPPPNAIIEFDRWFWKMERKKCPPIVSGLYYIKNSAEARKGKTGGIEQLGPEPLAYRGNGKRAFRDWNPGDVIWVSGFPTGAILIHRSVLEAWAREPDVKTYFLDGYPHPIKEIFRRPAEVWIDPSGSYSVSSGTSDLYFAQQTIKRNILTKAGWPKRFAKRRYPFIIDTSMRFGHVDRETGAIY